MKKVTLNIILFLIPLGLLNVFLFLEGFQFQEKSSYLSKKLSRKSVERNSINFIFFGTSRTNCGIDPETFNQVFQSYRIKTNTINLGIDGTSPYLGMILSQNKINQYDYAIIELNSFVPKENNKDLLKEETPANFMNSALSYYLNKICLLQKGISFILYFTNRNPIYFSKCHENGFCEIKHSNNRKAIDKQKIKVNSFEENWTQDSLSLKKYYQENINSIHSIFFHSNTKLIFLSMPVDGMVAKYQENALNRNDQILRLKKEFPEAIFIESSKDSILSRYKTFENSHLDANTARLFTADLAKIIAKKISLYPRM